MSCVHCHTFLITYPIKQEILHFTLSSSIIHSLWLSLVLLKVTYLICALPSSSICVSCRVTRPSSCGYCHNITLSLPSPFLIYFSLWLSLVLLKVTFTSRHAYIITLACVTHLVITSIILFPPFSILSYFAFSPTSFCSYLIWRISASLTLWLGPTYKAPCCIVFFCLLVHRANEALQHIHHHTHPCHAPSRHQHHPISLFSILSYFTFSPRSFHSYLIWHISTSLTLWLGPI